MRNHLEEKPLRKKAEKTLPKKPKASQKISAIDTEKLIHELEVHQVELEMQNEDLRKAQGEIEASRSRYTDLYDFAPVGYFTLDEKGVILAANLTGAKLLGTERKRLLKVPFSRFVISEDRDRFRECQRKVFQIPGRQSIELRMKRKANDLFWVGLESAAAEGPDGKLTEVRLALSDITDRKKAEEEVLRLNVELEARVTERTAQLEAANKALKDQIARQEQAEEEIRRSEREFRGIFELSSVGMVERDASTGEKVHVNQRLCEMTGYSAEELLSGEQVKLTHPGDWQRDQGVRAPVLKGELETWIIEKRLLRKNGEVIWVLVNGNLIRDSSGRPFRTVAVIQDITERKKAEETLSESEERFRALNETSPVGVGVSSAEGVLLYTNPAYDLILGYSRGELLGKKASDLYLNRNDRTSWLKAMKEGGAVRDVEIRLKRKDGTPVWVSINTSDISYGGKQAVMGTIQDITARKQAEEALAAANERTSWLASFPEENPNPVMRVAADGGILYCNPAVKKSMGWDYEVGQSLTDPLLKVFKRAMASGTEVQEDVALGNGAYAVSAAPIFGGSHANVYGRDITERKRAEEQLREREMRYRTLFDSMTEGFALHEILTDEQGRPCDYRFLDVNPAFEKLTGLKRDGLLGKCVSEVLPSTEAYWIEKYGKVALTGEPVHFENFAASLNRWYEVFAYRPVPGHFAAVFTDITDRKRAEEALDAAHRQLQGVIDNTTSLIYAFDLEERFVMANTATAELLSSTPQQIIGKRRHEVMPKEDADWHEANDRQVIEAGRALEFEEYSQIKGRSITWLTTKFPLHDAQGRIYAVAGISADITKRKEMEEELRLVLGRLQTFFDHRIGGIGIVIANARGDIIQANDYYLSILGCTREELQSGRVDWRTMTPPEWLPVDELALAQLRERGVCDTYEKEYQRRDGTRVPVLITDAMMPGDSGDILAFVLDITERKRAEEALRERENRLRRFYESGLIGVIYWNMDGKIMDANDKFLEMVGFRREDLMTGQIDWIHMTPSEYRHLDERSAAELKATGFNKEPFEKEYIRKDGTRLPIIIAGAMIDEARFNGVAFVLDISERKRAEEALQKAKDELEVRVQERTEELAKSQDRLQHLASQLLIAQEKERKRVAVELHDGLLSELAAMKMLFEAKMSLLEKGNLSNLSEFKKVADILGMVMREARGIMNNLHPSVLDELGLIAAMNWLTGQYEKSYPHIKVEKRFEVYEADIEESLRVVIFRVLQEALNNFAKHGKGDRVKLSLAKEDSTFAFTIQDNGQGFDVEKAEKGLGLESMRERVELSGGEFQVESIIGQGTTIRAIWRTG